MKTLRELIPMIDNNVNFLLVERLLSKEEFMEKYNNENMYNDIHNSKCGYIKVKHTITGDEHYGITAVFGENVACYISNEDEWFTTSIIQNINWKNRKFKTLNSVYEFEFEEFPEEILDNMKKNYRVKENESKGKEVE